MFRENNLTKIFCANFSRTFSLRKILARFYRKKLIRFEKPNIFPRNNIYIAHLRKICEPLNV